MSNISFNLVLFATFCTGGPHNAGFWQSQEAYFLGGWLAEPYRSIKRWCLVVVIYEWRKNRTKEGCLLKMGPRIRDNRSSFCLPEVYPVVYTPRRAAAPRADRASMRSKMNMWHIWLFFLFVFLEAGLRASKASSRRITSSVPILISLTHTPALPLCYCESMSPQW